MNETEEKIFKELIIQYLIEQIEKEENKEKEFDNDK